MSIFIVIILALLVAFGVAAVSAAPWVPVRRHDIPALVNDMNLRTGQIYVELGSGDGRLLQAVASTGANVVGYELNPIMWLISSLRVLGKPNARVILRSFWRQSVSEADVVMAFLIPRTMPRLEAKLEKEMKKGSTFISYIFPLPRTKPTHKTTKWLIYKY